MPPTDATPPPVQDTATTAPRTPSADSARPIGMSTVLVSAFLLYLGYEPSTGTSLVFSRSLFMLAIGYGVLSALSLAVKRIFQWDHGLRHPGLRLARSLWIAALAGVLLWRNHVQENEAIAFLEQQAVVATNLCNASGQCAACLPDWTEKAGTCSHRFVNSSHTRFVLRYGAKENIFVVHIHYGLDFDITRHGGVNRPITRRWGGMDGERAPAETPLPDAGEPLGR